MEKAEVCGTGEGCYVWPRRLWHSAPAQGFAAGRPRRCAQLLRRCLWIGLASMRLPKHETNIHVYIKDPKIAIFTLLTIYMISTIFSMFYSAGLVKRPGPAH